jgi:hypothetical protein
VWSLSLEDARAALGRTQGRARHHLAEDAGSALEGGRLQYVGQIAHQQGDSKRALLMLRRAVDEDPSLTVAKALLDELQG